ncbi:MAG: M23 family metallopeptidase [Parvibaculaceae bacterium]
MTAKFNGSNDGLETPARRLHVDSFGLRIANLDTSDPPAPYVDGGVPRAAKFNANVRRITAKPLKPEIAVECEVLGFDPKSAHIYWRLQTLHVLCRYKKVKSGAVGLPKNYADKVVKLSDEWIGESDRAAFTIFPQDAKVRPEDGSDRVAGGHAILTVAAKPAGASGWLQDYVHLRIDADNPDAGMKDVQAEVKALIGDRGDDLRHMVNAVFGWEARAQFSPKPQDHANFKKLGTRFEWPGDPPNYPIAAFDLGVGYSQFTDPDRLTASIAWDWRENLKTGINVFLDKLRNTYLKNSTWADWALRAWSAYNGTGQKNQITVYGRKLAGSPEGKLVSKGKIPSDIKLAAFLSPLLPRPMAKPSPWPVTGLPNIERPESVFDEPDEMGWDEDIDDEGAFFDPPRPVPEVRPFPFAASHTPARSRYWPVVSKNPQRLVVSYETVFERLVGKFDRRFLAKRQFRKDGTFERYHVGIDLFARRRDVVRACEDGVIVAFYPFYRSKTGQMTYALLVETADFVINYGQVRGDSRAKFKWRVGDKVAAGREIARIGDPGMLHFEMYRKGTRRNRHYYPGEPRPRALLNPTKYLLEICNDGHV